MYFNSSEERVKAAETHLALGPELRRVTEHIQQLFAHFFVELGCSGDLVEHHDKAGLWAGFMNRVGHAVIQRIPVLAEMGRQEELGRQQLEDICLGLRMREIGIEKVSAQSLSGGL